MFHNICLSLSGALDFQGACDSVWMFVCFFLFSAGRGISSYSYTYAHVDVHHVYTPVYHKIKCICLHIGAHTLCH